ncbi:helix-turn-helix domain-containing protein [Epibacterium sp. SM1969]|uniref:Helix-turn-helix domain-containing protein n=1 Tax=Tritonibacter aquimaris TaxID=2663379 RepID=A0A844AVZ4_9RHOB|nr:DUF6456 domain-containing protein [Tritonibacter aquimaris]MQY41376.1 helix-turn-helix domain-containing protein [Tritonibacter aquimaris]
MQTIKVTRVPRWIPEEVRRYLEHTENGRSIRQIARLAGCHPSTVMRQVRRVEALRDDPLIEVALEVLSKRFFQRVDKGMEGSAQLFGTGKEPPETRIYQVLGWLNRSQAVLAYAQGMDRAVIVCGPQGHEDKISLDKAEAGELALRGWVACLNKGRLSRYEISEDGRLALSEFLAREANRARLIRETGFSESTVAFQHAAQGKTRSARKLRCPTTDTPLMVLSRLLDPQGAPFVSADLVRAGERLREDFELAQIGTHINQAEQAFADGCADAAPVSPYRGAQERAMNALAALGPGLSDIALRCCCHLEGLEAAEKQLGWSARSGKVVLRIALQQLKFHYDTLLAEEEMIG